VRVLRWLITTAALPTDPACVAAQHPAVPTAVPVQHSRSGVPQLHSRACRPLLRLPFPPGILSPCLHTSTGSSLLRQGRVAALHCGCRCAHPCAAHRTLHGAAGGARRACAAPPLGRQRPLRTLQASHATLGSGHVPPGSACTTLPKSPPSLLGHAAESTSAGCAYNSRQSSCADVNSLLAAYQLAGSTPSSTAAW
jgi:hypothetical protein